MVLVSNRISQLDSIESELGRLRFLVPDIVLDELKHIQDVAGPKRSMIARTAIKIAHSKFELVKFRRSHPVDDAIVDYVRTNKCGSCNPGQGFKTKVDSNWNSRFYT